jgi:hypothetical protein
MQLISEVRIYPVRTDYCRPARKAVDYKYLLQNLGFIPLLWWNGVGDLGGGMGGWLVDPSLPLQHYMP